MRKFHNSISVGFFMGCVVSMSQLYFLLFLIYWGYAVDRKEDQLPHEEEMLSSFFSLVQSILLASFAAMLGAHRSQILDRENIGASMSNDFSMDSGGDRSAGYVSPSPTANFA